MGGCSESFYDPQPSTAPSLALSLILLYVECCSVQNFLQSHPFLLLLLCHIYTSISKYLMHRPKTIKEIIIRRHFESNSLEVLPFSSKHVFPMGNGHGHSELHKAKEMFEQYLAIPLHQGCFPLQPLPQPSSGSSA